MNRTSRVGNPRGAFWREMGQGALLSMLVGVGGAALLTLLVLVLLALTGGARSEVSSVDAWTPEPDAAGACVPPPRAQLMGGMPGQAPSCEKAPLYVPDAEPWQSDVSVYWI